MSLKKYRQKRHFRETPEPKGSQRPSSGLLHFVVQKHHASRLHYDFRLELGGVLKSWAVPKGPSLDPADKRLAMMVEDHPLDYATFEGIIPEGNYGAGTVMVWDNGTYEARGAHDRASSERFAEEGLKRGDLKIILHGRKLRGEFALVKLRRGEPNAWLLLKKKDEFATGEDITADDRSIESGLTLDQIAQGAGKSGEYWHKKNGRRTRVDLDDAPEAAMPRGVTPMLATLVDEAFDRRGWFFEVKWDGYRAIAEVRGGVVRLYSRNRKSFNDAYGPVVQSLRQIGHDVVLDGEVVVVACLSSSFCRTTRRAARGGSSITSLTFSTRMGTTCAICRSAAARKSCTSLSTGSQTSSSASTSKKREKLSSRRPPAPDSKGSWPRTPPALIGKDSAPTIGSRSRPSVDRRR
jgi:bifunctional non-homologous end joining protein LigD